MKILPFLLLFSFCYIATNAQVNEPGANRLLLMPEVAFGLGSGSNNGSFYVGMHGIADYRLNRYVMAGAGAGVMVELFDLYHSFFMPVFADLRLSLPTGTMTTPFIAGSAGYDLGFDDPGGLMFNPYLGIMHESSPQVGWSISAGYRTRASSLNGEMFNFINLRIGVAL